MKRALFFIFLLFGALNAKGETRIMLFSHFMGEGSFAFKLTPIHNIPCKMEDLAFLSFSDTSCFKSKNELKRLKKEYKKAIESVLKPGKNYYVTAKAVSKTHYICDVSNKKANFRLALVNSGLAKPVNTDETLKLAHKNAQNKKVGIYSSKFKALSECVFGKND